jgi:hypothetical protein
MAYCTVNWEVEHANARKSEGRFSNPSHRELHSSGPPMTDSLKVPPVLSLITSLGGILAAPCH